MPKIKLTDDEHDSLSELAVVQEAVKAKSAMLMAVLQTEMESLMRLQRGVWLGLQEKYGIDMARFMWRHDPKARELLGDLTPQAQAELQAKQAAQEAAFAASPVGRALALGIVPREMVDDGLVRPELIAGWHLDGSGCYVCPVAQDKAN